MNGQNRAVPFTFQAQGILSNVDQNATQIEERLTEVKEYLRWHRVPLATAQAVRQYYEFFYARRSAVDDAKILDNLTPILRREVTIHLLSKTVANVTGKLPLRSRLSSVLFPQRLGLGLGLGLGLAIGMVMGMVVGKR